MPRHEQVSPDEDPNPPSPMSAGTPSLTKSPEVAPPPAAAPRAYTASPTIIFEAETEAPTMQVAPVAPTAPPAAPVAPVAAPPTHTTASPATSGSSTNSVIYAVASFFFPGLGQLLAGQVLKGAVIFGVGIVTCAGFGLLPFVAAADAFLIGERKRRGEPVGDWQFF